VVWSLRSLALKKTQIIDCRALLLRNKGMEGGVSPAVVRSYASVLGVKCGIRSAEPNEANCLRRSVPGYAS
jgi:hypothetical protein